MIYTPETYCGKFLIGGKKVSPRTIKRCCEKGLLPSGHNPTKMPGDQGLWIIEVLNVEEKKPEPARTKINSKHYSWR